MTFVDTHAHLGDPKFDADRDSVFERAAAAARIRLVASGPWAPYAFASF